MAPGNQLPAVLIVSQGREGRGRLVIFAFLQVREGALVPGLLRLLRRAGIVPQGFEDLLRPGVLVRGQGRFSPGIPAVQDQLLPAGKPFRQTRGQRLGGLRLPGLQHRAGPGQVHPVRQRAVRFLPRLPQGRGQPGRFLSRKSVGVLRRQASVPPQDAPLRLREPLLRAGEAAQGGQRLPRLLEPVLLHRPVRRIQPPGGQAAPVDPRRQRQQRRRGQDPPAPFPADLPFPVVFLLPQALQPGRLLPGAPGLQIQLPLPLAHPAQHGSPAVLPEDHLPLPPAPGAYGLPVPVRPAADADPEVRLLARKADRALPGHVPQGVQLVSRLKPVGFVFLLRRGASPPDVPVLEPDLVQRRLRAFRPLRNLHRHRHREGDVRPPAQRPGPVHLPGDLLALPVPDSHRRLAGVDRPVRQVHQDQPDAVLLPPDFNRRDLRGAVQIHAHFHSSSTVCRMISASAVSLYRRISSTSGPPSVAVTYRRVISVPSPYSAVPQGAVPSVP